MNKVACIICENGEILFNFFIDEAIVIKETMIRYSYHTENKRKIHSILTRMDKSNFDIKINKQDYETNELFQDGKININLGESD